MKKVIIRFKEPTKKGYEVYYKEIPKIMTRFYFKRLADKRCMDMEIIDDKKIEKIIDENYNHIPYID